MSAEPILLTHDFDAGLARAKETGKHVLVDFSAAPA